MELYKNKYPDVATNLSRNVQNYIKQSSYFNELDNKINNLLWKKFCKNDKQVDKTFCKIEGSITNYINIDDLIYQIEKDLPQYNRIFSELFKNKNSLNLDLGIILLNASSLDKSYSLNGKLYNNVLMSIHNYIMSNLLDKYVNMMSHLYRLSKNYKISILEINLNNYKAYSEKLNKLYLTKEEKKSDYYSYIQTTNLIDMYVINNLNTDRPLYKKLLYLLEKTNSIDVVTLLASKIEKDLIYIRLEKKINLLKKNNINFSEEQIQFINSIINDNIVSDINLFTDDHKNKLNSYITSEHTPFNDIIKLRIKLIDMPKEGKNDENKINDNTLRILIIIVLILLIILLLFGICYAGMQFYYHIKFKNCNAHNSSNSNNNTNIM